MGSRLFANATSLLGGHDSTNQDHRDKVAGILGIDQKHIPSVPSQSYDQIIEGIAVGRIKGLWVLATNTSHSWIDSEDCNRALEKLTFLVVQDMYPTTDTAKRAHLYLPAAGWGEKDGTFINSERRIGLVKKVRRAPGLALSDFNILRLLAHHWGVGSMFKGWTSPAAAFKILTRLSKGQPCDISGIGGYEDLERCSGIQWPLKSGEPAEENAQRRLFADGRFFHPDGKAKFYFDEPTPTPEGPDKAYPFLLITGRGTSAQWHTNTRTAKSEVLRKLYPQECYVELHPDDALALRVENQDRVTVCSRRAAVHATVVVSACVQRGQVFMPMHYEEANKLTFKAFDPHSRQPSYKACAVRLEK